MNPKDSKEDLDKDALTNVFEGIVDMINKETPDSITYKDLTANKDDTLYDIFSTYDMAASQPHFIVTKIIKQKFGIMRISDELYWFVREFPVYVDKLEREIEVAEGPVCCVDKAWSRSIKKLEELIEASELTQPSQPERSDT